MVKVNKDHTQIFRGKVRKEKSSWRHKGSVNIGWVVLQTLSWIPIQNENFEADTIQSLVQSIFITKGKRFNLDFFFFNVQMTHSVIQEVSRLR